VVSEVSAILYKKIIEILVIAFTAADGRLADHDNSEKTFDETNDVGRWTVNVLVNFG
jgi:hypothetical protein